MSPIFFILISFLFYLLPQNSVCEYGAAATAAATTVLRRKKQMMTSYWKHGALFDFFLLFFSSDNFYRQKILHTHLSFSSVWYAHLSFFCRFSFLHISHSSFYTAESMYLFIVLFSCTYIVYILFCIEGTVVLFARLCH